LRQTAKAVLALIVGEGHRPVRKVMCCHPVQRIVTERLRLPPRILPTEAALKPGMLFMPDILMLNLETTVG
jgi:hypothetical protein